MMNRLNAQTLGELSTEVKQPAYDRGKLRPGIVHLGLGAFHRAHQALYTELAMAHAGGNWGIIGVSLRSENVSRQLLPQDGLYSVMSEDAAGSNLRVVGAITDVLVAPREPRRVTAAIADPQIQIVTLTITEKGYCLAADGKSLNVEDRAIAADLADPEHPCTAVGLLALGLRERLHGGGAPLTILSCDNLSENSTLLHAVLQDYLAASFSDVLPWLASSTAFPCSMVDRIVPGMTLQKRARQEALLGVVDEGAVATEPFSQWIIEDCFAADRPDWESVDVQVVDDILPYENIKLRLLNASHSAIAYCGLLAGKETVDQVMADPALRSYVQQLMEQDLMPALDAPPGFDLSDYRDQLLQRFSNPCLHHRCQQIAMDGCEKIGQRWLPILQAGEGCRALLIALSAWCQFVLHTDYELDDPKASQLFAWRHSDEPERL
ncbi:MAG: mannitol dehydrogenase family protein, partial [Alcanivorax sp.]|nr:mannitol dehydrogenase family protein [Alcanivorax sp.]